MRVEVVAPVPTDIDNEVVAESLSRTTTPLPTESMFPTTSPKSDHSESSPARKRARTDNTSSEHQLKKTRLSDPTPKITDRYIPQPINQTHLHSNGLLFTHEEIQKILAQYNQGKSLNTKIRDSALPYHATLVENPGNHNKAYLVINYRNTEDDSSLFSSKDKTQKSGVLAEGGMGHVRLTQVVEVDKVGDDWALIDNFDYHFGVRKVSKKELNANTKESIRDEALNTKLLGMHPDDFPILSFSQGYKDILILPFLPGQDLFYWMEKDLLTADEKNSIILQTLHHLQFIHNLGYVHRDIKPENIMVWRDDSTQQIRAKIVDYGLAKFHTEIHAPLKGTREYMPKELLRNTRTVQSFSSDIYALGGIAKCMLNAFKAYNEGERPHYIDEEENLPDYVTLEELPLFRFSNKLLNYNYLTKLSAIELTTCINQEKDNFIKDAEEKPNTLSTEHSREIILDLFNSGDIDLNTKISRRKEGATSPYDELNLKFSCTVIEYPTDPNLGYMLVYQQDLKQEWGMYSAKDLNQSGGVKAEDDITYHRSVKVFPLKKKDDEWVEDPDYLPTILARKVEHEGNDKLNFKHEVDAINTLRTYGSAIYYLSNGKQNILLPVHPGETLYAYTGLDRPLLSSFELVNIIEQLITQVADMHQKGWVHRNIKLENIYLTADKSHTIELHGFDAARKLGDLKKAKFRGALENMPLESLLGKHADKQNATEDWYQVGAVIKSLFTWIATDKENNLEYNTYFSRKADRAVNLYDFLESYELCETEADLEPIFNFANRLMQYEENLKCAGPTASDDSVKELASFFVDFWKHQKNQFENFEEIQKNKFSFVEPTAKAQPQPQPAQSKNSSAALPQTVISPYPGN
jgi:serine/threonine protein kinase